MAKGQAKREGMQKYLDQGIRSAQGNSASGAGEPVKTGATIVRREVRPPEERKQTRNPKQ